MEGWSERSQKGFQRMRTRRSEEDSGELNDLDWGRQPERESKI